MLLKCWQNITDNCVRSNTARINGHMVDSFYSRTFQGLKRSLDLEKRKYMSVDGKANSMLDDLTWKTEQEKLDMQRDFRYLSHGGQRLLKVLEKMFFFPGPGKF